MKKKLIFLMLVASLSIIGCDEEFVNYDNIDGQTLVKFKGAAIAGLPVQVNDSGSKTLTLTVSTLATVDRTVNISLVSSEVDESDLEYNETITILAGEYSGTFTVTVIDNSLVIGEDFEIVFNIDGVEGRDNISIPSSTQTLVVSVVCPIPEDFMVGEYEISDIDAVVGPGNGTENFAAGIITLEAGNAENEFANNQRIFTSAVLPAFNSNIETVIINLNCDVFQLGIVDPSLACAAGVSYLFTSTTRISSSIYSVSGSDALFVIEYVEDPNGSCGGPFASSFLLTKVN